MAESRVLVFTILFVFVWAKYGQVFAQEKRKCLFTNNYDVYITNRIPIDSGPLSLRCQSKSDDLGNHTLVFGQNFHWDFCESLFQNTLFFCHASWGSKQASFDAFKSKWNRHHTSVLFWEARDDALYLNKDSKTIIFEKRVDWH